MAWKDGVYGASGAGIRNAGASGNLLANPSLITVDRGTP